MNESLLEQLLRPLQDPSPCGKSLRYDPVFDQIMAARREDDANLPQGVWETALKKADWKQVIDLATKVLLTQSKDLQIAACLGEALIATQGLSGTVNAIHLIAGLCTDYWQSLHPLPEDGDMEYRLAPLEWADRAWSEALVQRALLIPAPGSTARGYTLADWKAALDIELQEDKGKSTNATNTTNTGQARYTDILEQITSLPIGDLQAYLRDLETAHTSLNTLRQKLTEFVADGAPRFALTSQSLNAIGDMFHVTRPQSQFDAAPTDSEQAMTDTSEHTPDNGVIKINNREDAYRKLSQIANYLATIEPHSPVPALIRRAVTWGHMPFEELMRDLMQNNGEIQRMLLK
jgi:type VI secretion system protein ImpA